MLICCGQFEASKLKFAVTQSVHTIVYLLKIKNTAMNIPPLFVCAISVLATQLMKYYPFLGLLMSECWVWATFFCQTSFKLDEMKIQIIIWLNGFPSMEIMMGYFWMVFRESKRLIVWLFVFIQSNKKNCLMRNVNFNS